MTEENIYKAPEADLSLADNTNVEYAGFWVRAVASIIDTILIILITLPLIWVFYGEDYWSSGSFVQGPVDFIISYVFPALAVILFWVYKSATPGKMIMGLKIVRQDDFGKLSVGQSIGRYLGYYLSSIALLIGFIWVAFDKKKQGWHDKLAKTVVIKS